jgi:hypothetical protein
MEIPNLSLEIRLASGTIERNNGKNKGYNRDEQGKG